MSTVIVDATLKEKLLAAGNEIEFRDEAGNLIARYVRPGVPLGYVIDGVLPSSEDLDRIEREDKGYSIDEVLTKLRELREKSS